MSKAAELAALISSQTALSDRSMIINGAMQVAQRSTSESSVTSGGYKTCDRWNVFGSSFGTYTVSQSSTSPDGFANSLKLDCTTADTSPAAGDHFGVQMKFEGQDLQQLQKGTSSAKSVTVSFFVRSNKTGTYTLELDDRDNTRSFSKTYTISSADTWEYKTVTFAGDTTGALDDDNANSFQLSWWLMAGSNFTSGTFTTGWESRTNANRVSSSNVNLSDSTSNEWYMTGVQFELGEQATPFEHKNINQVLHDCFRYYRRFSFDTPTLPGASAATSGAYGPGFHGVYNDTTVVIGVHEHNPPMRAGATFGFSQLSHFDLEPFDTAPTAMSTFSAANATHHSITATDGSSRTRGFGAFIACDAADGFYEFDAEL